MACRGSAAPTWFHHGLLQGNLCFSCSSVGFHSGEIVLLELVQHVSFSWAEFFTRLSSGSSVRSQVLPASLLCHRNLRGSRPPSGTHLLWHGILSYVTVPSTPVLHFQLIQYSSTETTAVPWPPASPGTSPRAAVKTFSDTNQ